MRSASRRAGGSPAGPPAASPASVLIALGSNLGDRALNLRRALHALRRVVSLGRLSPIHETAPVGAPPGPPLSLTGVAAGWPPLAPAELLDELQPIESRLGRRRSIRNAPRTIDLDLILYSAVAMRTDRLTLPHPRFREREFVMRPLRELELGWAV